MKNSDNLANLRALIHQRNGNCGGGGGGRRVRIKTRTWGGGSVRGKREKKFVDLMTGLTERDYPKPSFAATTIPHTSSPKPPPL